MLFMEAVKTVNPNSCSQLHKIIFDYFLKNLHLLRWLACDNHFRMYISQIIVVVQLKLEQCTTSPNKMGNKLFLNALCDKRGKIKNERMLLYLYYFPLKNYSLSPFWDNIWQNIFVYFIYK